MIFGLLADNPPDLVDGLFNAAVARQRQCDA
jgi:hypothetical protein